MQENHLQTILQSHLKPALPEGLEKRVLLAISGEIKTAARKKHYLRRFSLAASFALLFATALPILTTFFQGNLHDLFVTAITNIDAIKISDFFMAIVEYLPLENLTLVFIAITVIGFILSKKESATNLFLKSSHS